MKIASIDVPRTALTLFVSDMAIVLTASGFVLFLLTYLGVTPQTGGLATYLPHSTMGLGVALLYSSLILLTTFSLGLYQRRYMRGRQLLQSILVSAFLTLVAWLLADNLLLGNKTQLSAFAFQHILLFAVLAGLRPIVCLYYKRFAGKRRLVVVGSQAMVDMIRSVADRVTPSEFEVVQHHYLDCTHQRDNLDSLIKDIRGRAEADEIVIELPSTQLADLAADATLIPAKSAMRLSSTMSLVENYARWTDINMIATAGVPDLPERGFMFFWVKRLVETTIAAAGLIFALPVLLATMIAIKLDDGGSLFYRQTRVGKNGRHFSVLKFRSMVENAEASGKAQWAKKGDNRVTRVGDFLRKSRIDEIPQLLNIVKGDMALVGPRPERPEIVEDLKIAIPGYDNRHVVRPGVTGWAQISYPYGASVEDALWKTKFDMYYIRNWSIFLDLAIIVQTVRVVLFAEGSR